MQEESSLKKHFERELAIMNSSLTEGDELLITPYIEQIKEIIDIFSKQAHSGGSAPFATDAISRTIKAVLGFQILSPLTGEDSEWVDISEMHGSPLWQNIRDGGVFKDENGECRYSNSIVWVGEDQWDQFVGRINEYGSSNIIKEFPFMPKTFYISVRRELYDENNPEHKGLDTTTTGHGEMVYFIKDQNQIKEVFNYYKQKTND